MVNIKNKTTRKQTDLGGWSILGWILEKLAMMLWTEIRLAQGKKQWWPVVYTLMNAQDS
jgi:hypothetical protein